MLPGDRFERYTIEGVLGRGGMGCVYKAHDPKLGRDVAIKVLLPAGASGAVDTPSDEAKARILREARAAAALSHPNAVSIYDVGENEGTGPFLVMELVVGRSLREAAREPTTTLRDKVRWLVETASALAAAHDRGIVHRDVKPENVLVRSDGVAKVLDFGIARRSATAADPSAPTEAPLVTLTEQGAQIGTPLYMAPEQIKGDPIDGRADQFAWGVLAYETLAGKLPWRLDKGQLGVAASILTDTPRELEDVPSEVAAVVKRALSKDPNERFRSMRDAIEALSGALGERAAPSERSAAEPTAPGGAPKSEPPRSASPPSQRPFADARRYDTTQFKEIFQRALDKQEKEGKYGRDDLVAAARELGIRDEVLAAALEEEDAAAAAEEKSTARDEEEHADRRREVRKLMRSAATFAVVNVLCYFWLHLTTPWVLYGTLIALAFQSINVLFPRERREGLRESRRDRRRRRREERSAGRRSSEPRSSASTSDARIEEGVRILLGTTAKRRERVRIAEVPAEKSARSDGEALAERAAEEEADEAGERREKRLR